MASAPDVDSTDSDATAHQSDWVAETTNRN
jgi:hypothetical protein